MHIHNLGLKGLNTNVSYYFPKSQLQYSNIISIKWFYLFYIYYYFSYKQIDIN